MRHEVQVELIKELLSHLDAGTNVDAGSLCLQSTSTFTDRDQAADERERFFRQTPQCIGLSNDLADPGDFLTSNDVGVPILATRGSDGTFRAFVNSCRHRGALVESQASGNSKRFTCPFHAWSYDGDGSLVGLPKPDHFGEVDRECFGLVPLPADERHGMLFVHPDPAGHLDLDGLLGPWLNEELSTWRIDELVPISEDAYDTACNWKLAMDTFGETYHFPTLHKETLFNTFHGNVQCYAEEGDNHRMILCRREIDQMRHLPEAEWDITVAGLPVYWIFPNIIFMPSNFGCFLVRAFPDADDPGRHLSRIGFYMKPELRYATGPQAAEVNSFIETIAEGFASIIRNEDYVMSESQQTAANANALDHVVFGRNEPALHHYHRTYAAKLGLEPPRLVESAGRQPAATH